MYGDKNTKIASLSKYYLQRLFKIKIFCSMNILDPMEYLYEIFF